MTNRLTVDYERCTGCRLCETACAWQNEHTTNPEMARIRVYSWFPGIDVAVFCQKCQDHPCAAACPMDALKIGKDGCVTVEKELCIGCGACASACAADCIRLDPEINSPLICFQCNGDPACVKVCQTHALRYGPIEESELPEVRKKEAIRDDLMHKYVLTGG